MTLTVSVLGVPYDEQSSFLAGCAAGPTSIRNAFRSAASNTFCESGIDVGDHERIRDAGDINPGSGQAAREKIETTIADLVAQGHRVLSLGGDHSISWPILRGYSQQYPQLNVLHLDAHPDLYDELDGNRFSHATPMARALEDGLIRRLAQVGIRTMNRHQQEQADRFGVEVIPMNQWHREMRFEFDGPVYLTLDLDVLDPAFAPGISHYEPGGMSTREVISIIQGLDVDLVGADIVELNPSRDINGVTATVAAKFMKEILAKLAS
ncbi:MAG: agmatinase [Pirellulaceae bacterium]